MSISRVRRLLGRPSLTDYATGHRITEFGYTKAVGRYDRSLFIFFHRFGGGGVTSIQDSLPARTIRGAGIGSSRSTISRAFGRLHCSHGSCDATAHHHTMSFAFEHGRVDLIDFGPALPAG